MDSFKANFSVDRENNTITVKRDFAAPAADVWAAFTQRELLDQWWAPRPYKAVTKTIDFSTGGHWLYAMEGPEGDRSWVFVDIREVQDGRSFIARSDFSDEHGKLTHEHPGFLWNAEFTEADGITSMNAKLEFNSAEELETIISLGFREGFNMGLDQLEEILTNNNTNNTMATKITVQATVNAAPEKVWKLWSTPADIMQWNSPSPDWHSPKAENDLREGGSFNYRMEAKDGSMGFDFGGTYDKVVPNERIDYTMGDGRQVSNTFTANGNATDMIVTFDAETENPEEFQKAGWQAILDNFKNYAESR